MISFHKHTLAEIQQFVQEIELVERYVPNFQKLNTSFKLRANDRLASTRVTPYQGKLWIKDFGDPMRPKATSIYDFIMDEYKLDFDEMLCKIYDDFKLNLKSAKCVINREEKLINKNKSKTPTEILVKRRKWEQHDMIYWGQFGITIALLERNKIYPISHYWVKKYDQDEFTIFRSHKYSYTFDYYVHLGVFRRKIYQPYMTKTKWLSNADLTVVQNYESLPKEGGDILILQSSYKDSMVINTFDHHSIASISENSWFTESYWQKLKLKWKHIIYYANNDYPKPDNPGLQYAETIKKTYGVDYIHNADGDGSDISEYRSAHSFEESKKMFINLLSKKL